MWFLCETDEREEHHLRCHRVYSRGIETEEAAVELAKVPILTREGKELLPGIVHVETGHTDLKQISGGRGYVRRKSEGTGRPDRPPRYAVVRRSPRVSLERVRDYLPSNYSADVNPCTGDIHIVGHDDHGWTLDGYVIPRLASGLIAAEELPS